MKYIKRVLIIFIVVIIVVISGCTSEPNIKNENDQIEEVVEKKLK